MMQWLKEYPAPSSVYLINELQNAIAFLAPVRDGWAGYSWDGVLIAKATKLTAVKDAVENWARGMVAESSRVSVTPILDDVVDETGEDESNIVMCLKCKFAEPGIGDPHGRDFMCRFYPPSTKGYYPAVKSDDWCGQFQQATAKDLL